MQRKFSALLLLASLALSSCGVTGSLKTPPPLLFEKGAAPTESEKEDDTQDSLDIEDNRDINDILEELDD